MELPPLSNPDGGEDELVADHIRAVAMFYAASQLEEVGLMQVVDRLVALWLDGQLSVTSGPAGEALDMWFRESSGRMTSAERMNQFARVLGAPVVDSEEGQPNREFNELFMRFVSSLSDYDRQARNSNAVRKAGAGNVSDAQVRKAGRDLAANASLYGFGEALFAARRLSTQIASAVGILQMPDIQKAWGVESAWQVVERVSSQEFDSTPNVVKYRTMATSGKTILDLVAKYYDVWSSSDAPLFCPSANVTDDDCTIEADISLPDQRTLLQHTESWLLANAEAERGSDP